MQEIRLTTMAMSALSGRDPLGASTAPAFRPWQVRPPSLRFHHVIRISTVIPALGRVLVTVKVQENWSLDTEHSRVRGVQSHLM